MLWVRLFVGRSIFGVTSPTVTGFTLIALLLMRTKPKRKSLTSDGENKCVSDTLKNRSFTGRSYGKFRSVPLMLPPNDACKPPAPKGTWLSEFEKKKRAETLSLEP